MISETEFTEAEDIVIDMSDKDFLQLSKDAANAQPAIFTFISVCYESLTSEDGKDFFLHLVYSIWQAYKNKYKLRKVVSIDEIEKTETEEEENLKKIDSDEEAMLQEIIQRTTRHPQAILLSCIYSQIGEYYNLDDEVCPEDLNKEAGIISGAINTYINLLEKARNPLRITD
mgnify:CR=1 FL=1